MRTRQIAVAGLAALASLVFASEGVPANGGKSKKTRYQATVLVADAPQQRYQFDAELESLLFRLTALKDKYRVVRIRVVNSSQKTLVLSSADDAVQVEFPRGPVAGILNMGAADAAVWDALAPDLRQAIAYPKLVEGGEEEN